MSLFKYTKLPVEFKNVLENAVTINPGYIQIYLDHDDCEMFIEEFFPDYASFYHSVIPGAFRSDICRLLLLYQFGGVYNDIGHTYIESIDSFTHHDVKLVLVREANNHGIHNSFIQSAPKHPLLKKFIEHIMDNVSARKYTDNMLNITGPGAIGYALRKEIRKGNDYKFSLGIFELNEYVIQIIDHEWPVYIRDENRRFISTKIPNYYTIMYVNNSIPRYAELWKMGLVYH